MRRAALASRLVNLADLVDRSKRNAVPRMPMHCNLCSDFPSDSRAVVRPRLRRTLIRSSGSPALPSRLRVASLSVVPWSKTLSTPMASLAAPPARPLPPSFPVATTTLNTELTERYGDPAHPVRLVIANGGAGPTGVLRALCEDFVRSPSAEGLGPLSVAWL